MKAIILRGIPASGKSTYAKQLVAEGYVRINRDTIRKENPGCDEDGIRFIKNSMITNAALEGKNVVIDDTNISENTLSKTSSFLLNLKYTVEVKDIFAEMVAEYGEKEALDACIGRNYAREEGMVPTSVIYQMFLEAGYKIPSGAVMLVDLDGTLYDIKHRQKYVNNEDKKLNRRALFESNEMIALDTVHEPVARVVRAMYEAGYGIILVSGRKNTVCEVTIHNLMRDQVPYHALLMRNYYDNSKDSIVKKKFLDIIEKKHHVFAVIDDRPQVIDMWRENGKFVFNVGTGEIF